MGPCVVSAAKSGATSPIRKLMSPPSLDSADSSVCGFLMVTQGPSKLKLPQYPRLHHGSVTYATKWATIPDCWDRGAKGSNYRRRTNGHEKKHQEVAIDQGSEVHQVPEACS